MPPARHKVYLEVGAKRVFAAALDWPGWCRSGRDQDEALETLVAFAPRYKKALGRRVEAFAPPARVSSLQVAESIKGNATTDFGAPGLPADGDFRPLGEAEARRLETILKACWAKFDRTASSFSGRELEKGPRGGGRDLDAIVTHVMEAERAYLSGIARAFGPAKDADTKAMIAGLRRAELTTIWARVRGEPVPENPRRRAALWPVRYFVRRVAWHALDHAWEIEDRARVK